MTCRGDAAATDWLLFGGGRASVRFRPPFLCPGQSRDGGPGQNSKRGAGRVSGQDGGGRGADCGRPGQNSKRSAGRVGAPGRAGEHAQAVRRFGVVVLRAELQKGTRSVAAFQTKRERLRSVRRFGIRGRRQRSRQSEERSGRRQPQRGRRGEGRSDRRRQRSKRGEGRSDRWPQRGRRGTNRRGAGRHGPNR